MSQVFVEDEFECACGKCNEMTCIEIPMDRVA